MHSTANNFISLLQPHYNSAAQYCRALYQNDSDAEDGLQDAIMNATQHFHSLKDEKRFRSWFFTIVTRTFYAAKKQEARKEKLFSTLKQNSSEFPAIYEEALSAKERVLMKALHTLSEKERAAILLFELGGFSIQEIMQIQGESSLSAVKSRLSRTREKLRNTITLLEQVQEKGGNYDLTNSLSGH